MQPISWHDLISGIVASILLLAIVASVAAPAPRKTLQMPAVLVMCLAIFGMICSAGMVVRFHSAQVALWMAGVSVALASFATWLGRGCDPGDGDGGIGFKDPGDDGDGPDGTDPPELDWDEFDRQRRRWDRQPSRV